VYIVLGCLPGHVCPGYACRGRFHPIFVSKLRVSELGLWVWSDFHNPRVRRLRDSGELWAEGEKSALIDVVPIGGERSRSGEFES